ncbi:hypothetical protein [Paenibacillus sp. HJGM_3]|uniref:hypothetical protein n=1 Tax=Paenibacillus sp. HJGM_3 TaxID=3379816 RepID=UPI0038592EF2
MKRIMLLMLLVALTVLSACAKSGKETTDGHGGHGDSAPASSAGAEADKTKAVWKLSSETPQAKSDTKVSIAIQDDKGAAVEKFDISHEKKMHLIVVSDDLSYFNHIHPEYKEKGRFEIDTQFPAPGGYKLFADYVPTGGSAVTKSERITVGGTKPAPAPIVPDKDLTRSVAGKQVTLTIDHLMAGMQANLTFRIVEEKTKQPITDLQPYLGAVGHVVILSADAEQYLHVHPTEEKAKGPDAKFMTTFPKSGIYKIWGQFQHNGQVFTVPFVVQVP